MFPYFLWYDKRHFEVDVGVYLVFLWNILVFFYLLGDRICKNV